MGGTANSGSLSPIDADYLFTAMTASEDYLVGFLDLDTGAVELMPGDLSGGEFDAELQSFLDQPKRYVEVARVETREQYRWMCEFAASLADAPNVARMLDVALDGRGAFGRFRDVLARHPKLRDRWEAWESERLLEEATAWLEREGIERPLSIPYALREGTR